MNENQALLVGLKRKYDLLIKHAGWSDIYYDFKDELSRVTTTHGDGFEYQEAYMLSKHWMNLAKFLLDDKEGDVSALDLPLFLRYIANQYLVHSLAHDGLHTRTLAAMCTTQIAQEVDDDKQQRLGVVEPVLAMWLNRDAVMLDALSLADTINLMYGDGVWELYRADVANDIDLSQHLYDLNVPLIGTLKQLPRREHDISMPLPSDMFGLC